MEKILTVNDVADILQVKAITVREMFREKRLRGFKVGKAWRITEAMLQEDIDDLARGEAPKTLPTPAGAPPEKTTVQAVPDTTPEKDLAPTPEEAPAPPVKPAKTEGKTPAPTENEKDEDADEDTQQMLF